MDLRAGHVVRRARRALSRREYPVVPAHLGRIDYQGADIVIGVTSRTEILSRLRPCAKEPWTVDWLERTLRTGDVLYDVGANVGAYSLVAAALGRAERVFAVEPGFASYAALCDNILLNRQEEMVVPLPVLLGDRTALVTLGYRDVSPGGAEHSLGFDDEGRYRQPTLQYRLDDLVADFGLPAPNLLKIDVDGAESAVLAGAPLTLARPGLRSVLIEIERSTGDAVVGRLAVAGLKLAGQVDERDGTRLAGVWYGIFERA